MTASARHPQLARIARLLHISDDELLGLDELTAEQLRVLHDRIGELIFAGHQQRFARIAGLSKVIPGPLAGKLAERFLPPALAARVAEHLEPARARDLVTRVRVDYLADLTMSLDPTRSRPVVQAIPPHNVAQVARELFDRREYAAMAEFAGTVTLEALFAALEVATPHDLFEVAPLLVWNDNLDQVLSELSVDKILPLVDELVRTSRDEASEHGGYSVIDRLAPVMASVPTERVAEVARALFDRGKYQEMALFSGAVPTASILAAVAVASARDLLGVVPLLEWNDNLAEAIGELPLTVLDDVLREVADGELWDEANYLIDRLDAQLIEQALTRVGEVPDDVFDRLREAAASGKLTGQAVELLQRAEQLRTG
jgi:hypothetical protein